ncbi:MAG: exopolysaccharide biosynthesis protein, partial [Patescibacteria group bacterium]|nr:exopolysaccharide biosynthesis protein [Patescibacteria group bacterium]
GLCLGDAFDRVGEKGFGLLLVVLALPSALPVPAAGYSAPFGFALAMLALQMLSGKTAPVLPGVVRRMQLKGGFVCKMIEATQWFFRKVEHLIRPRMRWVGSRPGRMVMGVIVLLMAILMMIPIPTTNTAPAMVIFLIGVGLTEEDGVFAGLACVGGLLAIAFYAVLVTLVARYGLEAVDMVWGWVRGPFG